MEVAGLVLGAFPLAIELIYIYREQFNKLDDWVNFRETFISFADEIKHQNLLYRTTMTALLDPVIPDVAELNCLIEEHNREESQERWNNGSLDALLAERLGPDDWARFVRIVRRMDSTMKDLRKILKIKSHEKVGLRERKDPDKLPFTQVDRFRFIFSRRKFERLEKLKNYNQQLSEIIGCSDSHHPRAKDESSRRKDANGSNLSSMFESIRQNGLGIYSALKRHLCSGSQGACESHNVCLCIRADPKSPDLNFLFDFKVEGGAKQLMEYITIEPHTPPNKGDYSFKGGDPKLHLPAEPRSSNRSPGEAIRSSLRNSSQPSRNSFTKKVVNWGKSLGSSSSADEKSPLVTTTSIPISTNSGSVTTTSCGHLYRNGDTYITSPTLTLTATSDSLSTTTTSSTTSFYTAKTTVEGIGDICMRIHNPTGSNRELCIIANENERYFKVSNTFSKRRRAYQEAPRILSLPELLSLHEKFQNPDDFRITLEHRLSIAAHISAMLLQTYSTPWLPSEWSRRDIYFLKGDSGASVTDIYYPYLARPLGGRLAAETDSSDLDALEDDLSVVELEKITRESLYTLGIIISELILGCNICPSSEPPSTQLGGPANNGQSCRLYLLDHEAVKPRVSWLENEVLVRAGAEIKDVVHRCLQFGLGSAPNLKEKSFREKFYDEVVKPLANKSENWPLYFN